MALCNGCFTSAHTAATFYWQLGPYSIPAKSAGTMWHPDRFEQLCLAPGDEPYAFEDTALATATLGYPRWRMAYSISIPAHANSRDGTHWTWSMVVPTPTAVTKKEGGPGNRLWPSPIAMSVWPFQVQHDQHVHPPFCISIQPALWLGPWLFSGWLVYPIPLGGLGSTATGHYCSNRSTAGCQCHVHWALLPQRLVEDLGTVDLCGLSAHCWWVLLQIRCAKESIADFSCSMCCRC